ncbi:MAG: hypothetical protein WC881_02930 [Elusimicrobiota bacterium]|jgi:hypothetical protein
MVEGPKAGGLCWHCRKPAAPEDNFCRFCGKNLTGFPWYYQHWGIIACALLALGPFSLILVWRSPLISRPAQWAYTLSIGLLTYYVAMQCYRTWLVLHSVMSGMSAF